MSFPTPPEPDTTAERAVQIGAATPQDHKPVASEIISVPFRGHMLTVDLALWTLEVNEHFERNHASSGVRALFGEEQYSTILKYLPMGEFNDLMTAVGESRQAGK